MTINAYLFFGDNCEEAMEFYKSALGGELQVFRYEGSPMAEGMAPRDLSKVMHASLAGRDFTIMGADTPGKKPESGSHVLLNIQLHDEREAYGVFAKLSAGGTVTMEMQKTFWGAKFGTFVDKFGIGWMINCTLP